MKTTLILGAGASRAEGEAADIPDSLRPPLDATFFKQARGLDRPLFESVNERVFAKYRLDLDTESSRYSLEHIFNLVYDWVVDEGERVHDSVSCYQSLRHLLWKTIAATTDELRPTDSSPLYKLLWSLPSNSRSDHVDTITYNYDLLVEKCLDRLCKDTRQDMNFDIELCYCIHFGDSLPMTASAETFTTEGSRCDFEVIKPHGSANWFHMSTDENAASQALLGPSDDIWCCDDLTLREGYEAQVSHCEGEPLSLRYGRPILVPPVFEKNTQYRGLLQGLRQIGLRKIAGADRLVVYGYSFPQADVSAQAMFIGGLAGNRKKPEIHVIDVNPAVCERIVSLTGVRSLTYHCSVDDYLKTVG
ncbi:MAG: hypothetical protein ABIE70_08910 [bacterium]